jgi:hypothetical protein
MQSTWSQSIAVPAAASMNDSNILLLILVGSMTPANLDSELSPCRAAIRTQSRYMNRSATSILSTILGMGGNRSRSARIPAIWAAVSRACCNNPWSAARATASTAMATNSSTNVGALADQPRQAVAGQQVVPRLVNLALVRAEHRPCGQRPRRFAVLRHGGKRIAIALPSPEMSGS